MNPRSSHSLSKWVGSRSTEWTQSALKYSKMQGKGRDGENWNWGKAAKKTSVLERDGPSWKGNFCPRFLELPTLIETGRGPVPVPRAAAAPRSVLHFQQDTGKGGHSLLLCPPPNPPLGAGANSNHLWTTSWWCQKVLVPSNIHPCVKGLSCYCSPCLNRAFQPGMMIQSFTSRKMSLHQLLDMLKAPQQCSRAEMCFSAIPDHPCQQN